MTSEPTRLASAFAQRREEIIRLLRDLADVVASSEESPDAVYVVLSEGDVHRPYWHGYQQLDRLHSAGRAFADQTGSITKSPEEAAGERAKFRQMDRDRWETYYRDHPYSCACNFYDGKTARGLQQHITRSRNIPYERSGFRGEHKQKPPKEQETLRPLP